MKLKQRVWASIVKPKLSGLFAAILTAGSLIVGCNSSFAANQAFDSTSDPAYAGAISGGTNFNGINGGSNLLSWVILPNPVNPNFNDKGAIPGDGYSVEDDLFFVNATAYFWALFSADGVTNGVSATRGFTGGGLGIDQTFTTVVEFRNGDTGAHLGFELQDAAGNSLFNFYQVGNSGVNGYIVDAAGLHSGVNAGYNYTSSQTLGFVLTDSTHYTFSQNGLAIFNGTIVGGDPLVQVTYYSTNNSDAMYFQSLTVGSAAIAPPSFTNSFGNNTAPQSATMFARGQQRFSGVAYGVAPLTNQWSRSTDGVTFTNLIDGGEIIGSTTPALMLTNVTAGDAAYYQLTVSGPGGKIVSGPVTLTVINGAFTGTDTIQLASAVSPNAPTTAPYDISFNVNDWEYFQPLGTTFASKSANGAQSFTVPAGTGGIGSGNDSQSYLNFSGGVGAEASAVGDRDFAYSGGTLSFTHTMFAPVEELTVWYVFYNDAVNISVSSSGANSTPLTLNDYALPYNPDGDGTGQNHTYGALTYLLTGVVGDVFTFSTTPDAAGVTGGGGGNGGVQAVNAIGIGAALVVHAPVFTNSLGNNTSPKPATMFVGGQQRFTAVAYGTGPFTYQWSRGNDGVHFTNLTDGGEIIGSTNSSLTLTTVTAGDAGYYTLTVTGPGGSAQAAVSAPVTLTVITGSYTGTDTIQLGSAVSPNAPSTAPYNISANVTDWEYFQPTGQPGTNSASATGPHSFSETFTASGMGPGNVANGTDSQSYLEFFGGDGIETSATNDQNFSFWFAPTVLSFTHTLIAPVETVTVWYVSYNDAVDISVSSSGTNSTPLTLTDYALPYNPDGDGTGQNHSYGSLTYLLTGAVGDVFTFSTTPDAAGVTGGGGGNGGMQAVTATGIGTVAAQIPLNIQPAAGNVILSWKGVTGSGGKILQSTPTLSPSNWQPVTSVPSYNGTNDSVTIGVTNAAQFYRLQ